jgi:hypothetical protein
MWQQNIGTAVQKRMTVTIQKTILITPAKRLSNGVKSCGFPEDIAVFPEFSG